MHTRKENLAQQNLSFASLSKFHANIAQLRCGHQQNSLNGTESPMPMSIFPLSFILCPEGLLSLLEMLRNCRSSHEQGLTFTLFPLLGLGRLRPSFQIVKKPFLFAKNFYYKD
jgi:hypothetical protein